MRVLRVQLIPNNQLGRQVVRLPLYYCSVRGANRRPPGDDLHPAHEEVTTL